MRKSWKRSFLEILEASENPVTWSEKQKHLISWSGRLFRPRFHLYVAENSTSLAKDQMQGEEWTGNGEPNSHKQT